MNLYPDTSFLCSLYRNQEHTPVALSYRESMRDPLPFTALLEFEFLQAVRLQVFLHDNDRTKGYSRRVADQVVADWEADVAAGLCVLVPSDSEAVLRLAKAYSQMRTMEGGHRTLEILHVATAVHLGAREFLTFDARQRRLARHVGLRVPL